MHKKFDHSQSHKLDSEKRRKLLPPGEIINEIGIRKGQMIADIGCGTGFFTVPLARAVGNNGKVIVIDIDPVMLKKAEETVSKEKLKNVEILLSQENSFPIPENSIDIVFTATVYHELNEPGQFLKEALKVLKGSGQMIILDWDKIEEEQGPPFDHRKDAETVLTELRNSGFTILKIIPFNKSIYIIQAKKRSYRYLKP
ncbi:MAG: class I SAM-dependent methyltransferase [Spirochaetes bacterium]|nr:class I SAM-dependent methyltransferase [Spirochaetota bacterium]